MGLFLTYKDAFQIVEFILITLVALATPILFGLFVKRWATVISSSILGACLILFTGLGLIHCFIFTAVVYAVLVTIILFINLSMIRNYLVKDGKKSKNKTKKDTSISKIFDKSELYRIITNTVDKFSRTKTGAIITFQKSDDLKPLMKNGTIINAPVNQELLETIFYPGTRLHDGAVIIKDNKIVAASVYYDLTTRPLNGKYGSRHRAALGISEVSDSITVVVSEETGRISLVRDGTIESITIDNFPRLFSDAMEEDEQ